MAAPTSPAPLSQARVLGIAGWSGAGKTTLVVRLVPLLAARGLKVSTIKRAHHEFDIDHPGKDSYEHRKAGAGEVLIASSRRWALMHELRDEPEQSLADLLRRLSPCDLILVEGFKEAPHPKLEVLRPSVGKAALYPRDDTVLAVASDEPLKAGVPVVDLDDAGAIADLVCTLAQPLELVLAKLDGAHSAP